MRATAPAKWFDHLAGPPPTLSPCPCGAAANWYRIVLYPEFARDQETIIGVQAANDLDEDLCDRCLMARVVSGAGDTGWVRHPDRVPEKRPFDAVRDLL